MTEQPKSDVQLCCEALAAAQQVWLEHEQAQRLTGSGQPSEVDELRQQLADALEAQQILGQRVVELEAELKQVNEHADNCTDIVLDQYQRAEQAESERDAARAGLGRAVDMLADAATCLEMARHVSSESSGHIERALQTARACRTILADPLGQQALAEWQRLRDVAEAAQGVCDWYESWQGTNEVWITLRAALDALQQQPAAGEGQQDG